MSIPVTCASCTRSFKVKDKYEGAKGFCPHCTSRIEVPSRVMEVEEEDSDLHVLSTTSVSLCTQMALATCSKCFKSIPEDSPECFFCGAPNAIDTDLDIDGI